MADSHAALDSLASSLGHRFHDRELLLLALRHRSWCAENPGHESNERLEFLGDSVLGLAITETLFRKQPDQSEGDLAKARAEVVSTQSLATAARSIGLGPLLRLGRGEEMSGGHEKDSILADAMEAVIGAVFLDAGWDAARATIDHLLGDAAVEAQSTPGERDYKTRLQELAAELDLNAPTYRITTSGPDHRRAFASTVKAGEVIGSGRGSSKKQAQQRAAQNALSQLEELRNVGQVAVSEKAKEAEANGSSEGIGDEG